MATTFPVSDDFNNAFSDKLNPSNWGFISGRWRSGIISTHICSISTWSYTYRLETDWPSNHYSITDPQYPTSPPYTAGYNQGPGVRIQSLSGLYDGYYINPMTQQSVQIAKHTGSNVFVNLSSVDNDVANSWKKMYVIGTEITLEFLHQTTSVLTTLSVVDATYSTGVPGIVCGNNKAVGYWEGGIIDVGYSAPFPSFRWV